MHIFKYGFTKTLAHKPSPIWSDAVIIALKYRSDRIVVVKKNSLIQPVREKSKTILISKVFDTTISKIRPYYSYIT